MGVRRGGAMAVMGVVELLRPTGDGPQLIYIDEPWGGDGSSALR